MKLYFNNITYDCSNFGLFESTELYEDSNDDYTNAVDTDKAKKAMTEPDETNEFIKKLNSTISYNNSNNQNNDSIKTTIEDLNKSSNIIASLKI